MSPSSLLALLDRSLEVLTGGPRDLADRQRTLRAAISWSYELLDEDEKRLFCRLGVFSGGFTPEAAEAVADRGDLSLPVWDGISSLVDKSLVRLTDQDAERFSMLETIRSFALEKLEESGEAEEIRRAHAEYFRALAEEAEPHLVGRDQKEWLPKLEIEHDNIRSALEWCLGHDGAGAVALAGALWRFWDIRSYFTEGRSWLERALQHSGASSPDLVAHVLRGIAALAEAQDDLAYAASRAEEALRLYRSLNRSREAVSCLSALGVIAYRQGDLPRARALCEEATDKARDAGDRSGLGRALVNLGLVLAAEDDVAEAERAYDEALALQRDMGDSLAAATTLLNLGELAVHRGDPSGAKVLLEEALEHARSLGDHYAMCVALTNLGLALLLDKDGTSASRVLRESLLVAQHMESSYVVACALEALGCAAALEKERHRTAVLFGAAHKLRKDSHVPLSRAEERFYESFLASVRRVQDSIEWDKGWGEGVTMSVHDAIEFGYDDIRR